MKEDLKGKKVLLRPTPYKQSHPRGCGPSSLLMILNFFLPDQFPLTREKELEIYNFAKFRDDGSTSIPGLAEYALRAGMKARLWTRGRLPGQPENMPETEYLQAIEVLKQHLSDATGHGLELRIGDFKIPELLLEELHARRLIVALVRLNRSATITHNIVIRGHDNYKICCVDPMESFGFVVYSIPIIEYMMDTPFAKCALAIGPS